MHVEGISQSCSSGAALRFASGVARWLSIWIRSLPRMSTTTLVRITAVQGVIVNEYYMQDMW